MSVIIDTCILIDVLKGKITLDTQYAYVTDVIAIELLQGVKNKIEMEKAKKLLVSFDTLPMPQEISILAKELIVRYALSHSLKLADALIAASCLIYDLPLWTYNVKDFAYIEGMKIYQDQKFLH